MSKYKINHAINVIKEKYGDIVSVDLKSEDLLKFGKNPNADTTISTIWYTGQDQANETYVAANVNSIDSVSGNNASDNKQVVIEGHTEVGGNKTFVIQTVTLNGQNRVPLPTPLNRSTSLFNDDSSDLLGEVYIYENTALASGKPIDTTKIHLTLEAGRNQSEKASTSISSQDYWIITGFRGSVFRKTSTVADVSLEIRLPNKVFKQVEDVTCSSESAGVLNFNPYLVVPPNSDVRLRGTSSSAGTVITGSIQGYLAVII